MLLNHMSSLRKLRRHPMLNITQLLILRPLLHKQMISAEAPPPVPPQSPQLRPSNRPQKPV